MPRASRSWPPLRDVFKSEVDSNFPSSLVLGSTRLRGGRWSDLGEINRRNSGTSNPPVAHSLSGARQIHFVLPLVSSHPLSRSRPRFHQVLIQFAREKSRGAIRFPTELTLPDAIERSLFDFHFLNFTRWHDGNFSCAFFSAELLH